MDIISNIEFKWPYAILAFFIPILLDFFIRRKNSKQNIPNINFPYLGKLQLLQKANKFNLSHNKGYSIIIFYLIWLCLTLALTQPQIINKTTEIEVEGYDLILAVDISSSMLALDFSNKGKRASRLEVTKKVVQDFVRKRSGDRIGLVVFGKNSYLHVPLTFDVATAATMLNDIEAGMAGDSTSIGDAIGMSLKHLKDKENNSRAIILLTDGSDNSSSVPPLIAANLAKDYSIPIYAIAMGNKNLVPYPTQNGRTTMVQMFVDKKLLQKISQITNGEFFNATDEKSLTKIYEKINQLKKTKSKINNRITAKSIHQYPILFALILLIIMILRKKWI
ncbi:VWA domain-containing protein [Flavobacteriaceae bacterium]|nr:VWA domain-containing protein [Flavobacteriaceae bacterium]